MNSGFLGFNDSSSAANAKITNDGFTHFQGNSSAASAQITNNSVVFFNDNSSAGSATITNSGFLFFNDSSSAVNSKITNESFLSFEGKSTAASAQITNNSEIVFNESATAADATIIGGTTRFRGNSSGGKARLIGNERGLVDIAGLASGGMTVGSIEGSGTFFLGSKALTVGGNNLSTTVTGSITDLCPASNFPRPDRCNTRTVVPERGGRL
jgi:hypothetical protein